MVDTSNYLDPKLKKYLDKALIQPAEDLDPGLEYLRGVTGITNLNTDYVEKHKTELNKKFGVIAEYQGYGSFAKMYYAILTGIGGNSVNSIYKSSSSGKSKRKDTSKLALVPKTVIRNGKPMVTRAYEDTSKSKQAKVEKPSDTNTQPTINDGMYFCSNTFGVTTPNNVKKAKPPKNWFTIGKYSDKLFDYVFIIANGVIVAVAGLKQKRGIISIEYISSMTDKLAASYTLKVVARALKEAWLNEYGFAIDVNMFAPYIPLAKVSEFYGLKKKRNNVYEAKPKELMDRLGDPKWQELT